MLESGWHGSVMLFKQEVGLDDSRAPFQHELFSDTVNLTL